MDEPGKRPRDPSYGKGSHAKRGEEKLRCLPYHNPTNDFVCIEWDGSGASRSVPVETYTEILGLTNAAYVAQHLHHHLKTRLGLDVWLPSGFCSAVRMASFIATTNDRPEAFSLFSCGPQPLDKKSLTGGADDSDTPDDLMRMQLKVADSTTGLSDKDIKKLTLVRHVVPRDFRSSPNCSRTWRG